MQRQPMFSAAVLVFVLVACGPSVPSTEDGATLFEYSCARCHGMNGRGEPAMKAQLGVPDMTDPAWQLKFTDEELVRAVRLGSRGGKMPPFGVDTFSPKQLDAIVSYVRRWRPPR
ncbi:MAG: cytochrome c [Myxococcales bacterium]|nr:cytochrome c [Myxococcales bacterium]